MSVNEKMTAIADAIRDKTGGSEALTLDDMESGINEVYKAGKYEKELEFVQRFTGYGTRKNYNNAFYNADFGGYTFNIVPTSTQFLFTYYKGEKLPNGIDCSNINTTVYANTASFCAYSMLKEFPDINIPATRYWEASFRDCEQLESIKVIRAAEGAGASFNIAFYRCFALKNIGFEGVISVDISFAQSPLTLESIISILTHLKDYSADTANKGKYTLTLKDTCKTLMAQQGAMVELGGKTYDAYIADKGWNLA